MSEKVLFVCSGNVFRSLTAELMLRKYLEENNINGVEVDSAGVELNKRPVIHLTTLSQLNEYGLVVKSHEPKEPTKMLLQESDYVITMGEEHQQYLKREFNTDSLLFNKACYDEETSVKDINDAVPDYEDDREAEDEYIRETIDYIHDSIPLLVKALSLK